MNTIFKPAMTVMTGQILSFAITLCLPIVLVRIFGPAEFGTYKQLFLIYITLWGIAQLGLAQCLYYFLPTASEDGGGYVGNSMLVLAAAGLLCLGVLTGAATTISSWLGNSGLAPLLPFMGVFLLLT